MKKMRKVTTLTLFLILAINVTAQWKIIKFEDDFGNPTEDGMACTVKGTFSNSAVENKELKVVIQVYDKASIDFKFYEYEDKKAHFIRKDSGSARISLADGTVMPVDILVHDSYISHVFLISKLLKALKKETEPVKIIIKVDSYTKYKFSIPVENFKEYYKEMRFR